MSFLDIVNEEKEKLKNNGGNSNDKVEYPKTKHDRLFFSGKDQSMFVQILPHPDLKSKFWKEIRKIFLTTKSSQGKEVKANFILEAKGDPGSLLEQKIQEWTEKEILPKGRYGMPTPSTAYLVNAVRLFQDQTGGWVQERDPQTGELVVRVLELRPSAMDEILNKVTNAMYNISQTEVAFLHPDKACVTQIEKPLETDSVKKYKVHVFPHLPLPSLGQGWENQLEDLEAQGVPTERLVNGDKWVQAFVDMMEGRKPNQNQGSPAAPSVNPYANQQQPSGNPFAGQVPQQGTYNQPVTPSAAAPQQGVHNQFETPQQPNITMPTGMGTQAPPPSQPQAAANPNQVPVNNPGTAPTQATGGLSVDPLPAAFGAPSQPNAAPADGVPLHSLEANNNGLLNVDELLQQEVGNLPTE